MKVTLELEFVEQRLPAYSHHDPIHSIQPITFALTHTAPTIGWVES